MSISAPHPVFAGRQPTLHSPFALRSANDAQQKLAFVESKTLDFQQIENMLGECADANRWANKGPLYHRLAESYAEFFELKDGWTVVPCANCGIGLEALARLLAWRHGRKLRWVAPSYSFTNIGRGYFADVTFIDCDREGTLSLAELGELDPGSYDGIILVNGFGMSDQLDPYIRFAQAQGKELIIDNACGIGQKLPDWPWQSFSLHHTKPFGFGEGGLSIVPTDAAEEYYSLIDYGDAPSLPDTWLGNGKISEVACAFHIERLESAHQWAFEYLTQTERVIELAQRCGLHLLKLNTILPPTTSLPFLAEAEISPERIEGSQHVMFAKYYKPQAVTPNATDIYRRVVNVPTHAGMSTVSDAQIMSDLERVQSKGLVAA